MNAGPRIVIVAENPARAAILEEGLRDAGWLQVTHLARTANLLPEIHALDPEVILIDLGKASREGLEQVFHVSRIVKRPLAVFVDQSDTAAIQASVDAGVCAYVVDGLKRERIKPILDTCMARFNAFARLERERDAARHALEERKVIDRAKGLLMRMKSLTEDEAYALMRRTAMNQNRKIADIAQSVVAAAEVLK